jgi:hypothetical protein
VVLVPIALALSGRWKAAAACATTVAVLAASCLVALGADGVEAYQRSLAFELGRPFIVHHTLASNLPSWAPLTLVRAAIAAAALVPALFAGAQRYERAIAAAVLGSCLVTPYLNGEDLTILVVCAWLVLRSGQSGWAQAAVVVSYPFLALENQLGVTPLLWVEVAWLAILAWAAVTRHDGAAAVIERGAHGVRARLAARA